MPRKRKAKPDDLKLTLQVEKRWPLAEAVRLYSWEKDEGLENLGYELAHISKNTRRHRIAVAMAKALADYPMTKFFDTYVTSEAYSLFYIDGGGEELDDFIGEQYSELYSDVERQCALRTRKRKDDE